MRRPIGITGADRLIAYEDAIDRALGKTVKARRRRHLRFGKLEVIVVETTDEPTRVYLANAHEGADLVETTASELAQAANAISGLLANPPPIRIKRSR